MSARFFTSTEFSEAGTQSGRRWSATEKAFKAIRDHLGEEGAGPGGSFTVSWSSTRVASCSEM
jgi:hypothetical protein